MINLLLILLLNVTQPITNTYEAQTPTYEFYSTSPLLPQNSSDRNTLFETSSFGPRRAIIDDDDFEEPEITDPSMPIGSNIGVLIFFVICYTIFGIQLQIKRNTKTKHNNSI